MVDPIKVKFFLSENEYLKYIKPYFGDPKSLVQVSKRGGLGLQVLLSDSTIYPHPGRLLAINNQVTQNTGSLQIEAEFPNPGSLLRTGQFARVRGVTSWEKDALLVPQRAINDLQGKAQIAVVGQDGKVDLRLVETGPMYASMQVVSKGLSPGENVVVEGMQKLREGMVVKTQPWKMPEGFAEDPSLPAPVKPDNTDFDRLPPRAGLDGAPAAETSAATDGNAAPAASPSTPAN
jgi:membrane fusion protein (multidrug efflux system)